MVKKVSAFLMIVLLILSLAACGNTGQSTEKSSAQAESVQNTEQKASLAEEFQETETSETETSTEAAESTEVTESEVVAENGKTLVVYFSWSTSGNTEKMASYIQEQTGADILKLEPVKPYPADYSETADVAKAERDENARPEIANPLESISEYDTIFIGYPIWWHTAPMIIGTFLDNYDFTGIDIYPFTQSASKIGRASL